MMSERASSGESTSVFERAKMNERTTTPERPMSANIGDFPKRTKIEESANSLERATFTERTGPEERAIAPESTNYDERALAAIDDITLAYMELVSGKRGAEAIAAWLRYTGWRDESDGPRRAKGAPRPVADVADEDRFTSRRQISVEARLIRAFYCAREA